MVSAVGPWLSGPGVAVTVLICAYGRLGTGLIHRLLGVGLVVGTGSAQEVHMSVQEQTAVAWMRVNGFPDATVHDPTIDTGVDIIAVSAVAQVRSGAQLVTGADLMRFASSSASMVGKNRLVFARAGYADDAVALADAHGLALFIERQGADMVPVNGRAQGLLLARRGAVPPPTASPYTAPGPLPVAAAPVPPPSSLTPVSLPAPGSFTTRPRLWSRQGVWYVMAVFFAGTAAIEALEPSPENAANNSLTTRLIVAAMFVAFAVLSWRHGRNLGSRRRQG